jgi:FtsP/CotA-like multicopper oxidase with cupredoxin domain
MGNVVQALTTGETVPRGARIRLRLINPSIDRVYTVQIGGLAAHVVAVVGMPLQRPRALGQFTLAPGQRCDLIGDVTGDVVLTDSGGTIGRIPVVGVKTRRDTPLPILTPNNMPEPSSRPIQATLTLQGGAGGRGHGGYGTWALNDVSGLPRTPLLDVRRGTSVRLRVENATGFDHVMHLHGHHFWELDPATDAVGDYRDGTFIRAGDTQDILCVLGNPGDWMLHCHMLSHQADGMGTWLRVR